MKAVVKFKMILWASIGIFATAISIYMFGANQNGDGIYFGIVAIAGAVMFYINRRFYHIHFGSKQAPPQQKN